MAPESSDQFIEVEGIGEVHYVSSGQGPPVVLLHGLAASGMAWRDNIAALSPRYRVVVPDLPGHGDSAKPHITYGLETGLRFLSGFLDALGLERVALAGNSTGGYLALAWSLRHPDRVRALVLADIPGLGRGLAWPLRMAALPGVGWLLEKMDGRSGQRFAPKLFLHPQRVDPQVGQELRRLWELPGVRRAVLSTLRSSVGLLGLRSSLLLLHDSAVPSPVPTLVLWGQEDRIIPVRHAQRLIGRFPPVQVRILPDCGHWPQMEQAQAFNAAMLEFLDQHVAMNNGNR